MAFLKRFREFLSLKYAAQFKDDDLFDKDFRHVLKIFYFFGFYRPVSSIYRSIYGLLSFLSVVVLFLLGMLKGVLLSLYQGHLQRTLFCVASSCLCISITTQVITFVINESEIVEIIKAIQSIYSHEDDEILEYYRKKFHQLVKFYRTYCDVALVLLVLLILFDLKIFVLILPALYDIYAQGTFYFPFLLINIIHIYFIALCLLATDLIHILCMARSGAYYQILSNKLRCCTDSDVLSENENNLSACVKYHQRIIEETNNVTRIFGPFFMSKVVGTLVTLSCYFFAMMNESVQEDSMARFYVCVGLGIAFFQIGTLCMVGQYLTTKSEETLFASYDCQWYNQSSLFKKTLIIFRTECQREMKVGVLEFYFTRAFFYEVITNSYKFYNNMSQALT